MKLKLTVDGKVYEVDVEVFESDPHPAYVPPPGQVRVPANTPPPAAAAPAPPPKPGAGAEPVADEAKVCRSPFSGTVSRVAVQVGQDIQVNDILVVLEAMKMETEITAPIAGKVARLTVAQGDAVQAGQVLVEFA
ncbi:MAG: biotin/lipoyl-binding protein [Thermoleophilia bacterium]|nr:biotin/lipoyl-binding protein [Thermoleophilia bacterium]